MSNPFKKIADNSKTSKNKSQFKDSKTSSEVSSNTCGQCGAPRPKNTNLTTCDYCGFRFMDIDTIVKSDT